MLDAAAAALKDDEIHVWHVSAYSPSLGRQPLLHVLSAYLGQDKTAIQLESEEHGRPRLAAGYDSSLDFNWSHSGDHALIAVGRHVRPGVDVECVRPRQRLLEIARRYFDPVEVSLLERLAEGARLEAFLAMWTAKEAVLKALGRGIAFGLDRVGVDLEDGAPALRRLGDDDGGGWQLQGFSPAAGVLAALAWKGERRHVRTGRLAAMA